MTATTERPFGRVTSGSGFLIGFTGRSGTERKNSYQSQQYRKLKPRNCVQTSQPFDYALAIVRAL
jgi:hypothetical protein